MKKKKLIQKMKMKEKKTNRKKREINKKKIRNVYDCLHEIGVDWIREGGMTWYVLDDEGNPVKEPNLLIASQWFEDSQNDNRRIVAVTEIPGINAQLSTVFLALDHGFRGQPMLYESLWFGGPNDGEMRRYSTKEEALEGHKELLREAGYGETVEVIQPNAIDWRVNALKNLSLFKDVKDD
jgi:hypothetical protein